MAIRIFLYLLLTYSLSACSLVDDDYPLQRSYSAVLEITNATDQTLRLSSIHQSTDAPAIFGIKLDAILTTQSLQENIREETYSAIAAGHFFLNGHCGDNKTWEIKGSDGVSAKLLSIETAEQEMRVSIVVHKCEH